MGTNYIPGTGASFSLDEIHPNPLLCAIDATKKSGQRLVGDVDYASASKVASYITPVPGGVGPMTVALLMENTFKSAERLWERSRSRKIRPLKLNILENVPRYDSFYLRFA